VSEGRQALSGDNATPGYTLVMGPESADRGWIEGVLLRGGLLVHVATEGEVLATREIRPPRLVILDDSRGRVERQATFRHLHAHPSLQGVPILVLAYDADIESFSDAITKGAAAYLVKPVSAEELLAVAQRLSGWMDRGDRTEKRRRLRRPLLLKVDIDIRSRKVRVPGLMVDACGGGCRVELGEEIPKGDLVRIILQAHDASTHLALGGEVRWHRKAPSGVHVIGVRFTGMTALLAGKLLGFASSGLT